MNPKKLKEILASHSEELLQGRPGPENPSDLSTEDEAELYSLMDVAEQVKSILRPVAPTRGFETTLGCIPCNLARHALCNRGQFRAFRYPSWLHPWRF